MALQVWLPLNGNLDNQGLKDITVTNNGVTVDNNGKIGQCYYFNGSGSSISTTYPTNIGTGDFSISLWVKIPTISTGSYYAICTSKTTSAVSTGVGIYWNYTQKKFLWSTADGTNATEIFMADAVDSIVYDKWIHLVMVRDSSDVKKGCFYINGTRYELASVPAIRNITTTSYLTLGKTTNGAYYTKMYINDFRIYNQALSKKEVKELSKGLVCHYPLSGANNTLLPFGYQQLDYIESAGAAAFDTTYKFNPETDSVKITFKGNDTSNNGMLFGQSAGKYFWLYYYGSNGIRVYADNGSGQQSIAGISSDLNKHTAEYKNKHYYIDGTDKGSLSNAYAEQPTTSWICSYGGTSYGFKGRIYYAQICRSGVPQRTFIPAKRLSDSKIGMYDVSNNVFYPSSTSTAFTAGDIVGTPTTIYDCSGYQNNGTVNGSLTTSNDTARYSVSTYIPQAGYIQHPNALGSDTMNQEWTCCAWVKLDNTSASQRMNDFNLGNNIVHSANSTPLLYLNGGTHDYYRYGSVAIQANVWTHIAFVFRNSNGLRNVYVNGVLTNSSSAPNKDYTPAGIPDTITVFGGYFAGYTSDYREYATALSADDIKELYETSASIDNNGNMFAYEFSEPNDDELLAVPYTNSVYVSDPTAEYTTRNSDGEYYYEGAMISSGSEYIKINPTRKTYYYDAMISVSAGNQFYIGFERYDANKTSRSNNACAYITAPKPSSDLVRYRCRGTVDLSTDGVNPCDTIRIRILNGWTGSDSSSTKKATVHYLSLREVATPETTSISKQGITKTDMLLESDLKDIEKNGTINMKQFIER